MYSIQATITRFDGRWESVTQVPTFLLNGSIQGIFTDGAAAEYAGRMIRKIGGDDVTKVSCSVISSDDFPEILT